MPNRQQAIIWTNADLIHWHLYAALRQDELNKFPRKVGRLSTHWFLCYSPGSPYHSDNILWCLKPTEPMPNTLKPEHYGFLHSILVSIWVQIFTLGDTLIPTSRGRTDPPHPSPHRTPQRRVSFIFPQLSFIYVLFHSPVWISVPVHMTCSQWLEKITCSK